MDLELTLWQKKQATILYHFASTEYLRGIERLVDDLMVLTDGALARAESEGRDRFLSDERWGNRDTAANWANNAWQFILDFKHSLVRDIAARANDDYQYTGTNQFIRATNEYSLYWTTPDEEQAVENLISQISNRGARVDKTLAKQFVKSRWNDFGFAMTWEEYGARFTRLPRFKVCADIEAVSGANPPRTGVYIPQDDVHGALQFASRNGLAAQLLECPTFNEIGLHALKFMGRRELWFNAPKMYEFATLPQYRDMFKSDMSIVDKVHPNLAPSAVAMHAFTSRPCKWYFVEMIEGEFEDYDDSTIPGPIDEQVRVMAGQRCPKAGYYFTPAKDASRRYFEAGDIMPDFPNNWGTVIWQYCK